MSAPLLFLDIDGVLALPRDWGNPDRARYKTGPAYGFDPDCLKAFNEACDHLGAEIVVSSSWRIGHTLDSLRAVLAERGVTAPVVSMTDNGFAVWGTEHTRGDEIVYWLQQAEKGERGPVERYAIVDDSRDAMVLRRTAARVRPALKCLTMTKYGFTERHRDRLVAALS